MIRVIPNRTVSPPSLSRRVRPRNVAHLAVVVVRQPKVFSGSRGSAAAAIVDIGAQALFIIVAVLFVIGVILLLAFVKKNLEVIKAYYNERKERIKETGGKITALVVTMQIIILVNENHKDLRGNGFPQPFEQFIEFFNFLTLDMINIIPVGCIFGHVSHYNKLVVWTVGPTAMVAIVGTVICFVKEATTKVRVSFSRFVVYERM